METIRLTNQQVMDAHPALAWLDQQDLPQKIGYRVGRAMEMIERERKVIARLHDRVLEKHAEKDDEGAPRFERDRRTGKEVYGVFDISARNRALADQEIEELMEQETEVRTMIFARADFDFTVDPAVPDARLKVPPFVWRKLGPLLKENVEAEAELAQAAGTAAE